MSQFDAAGPFSTSGTTIGAATADLTGERSRSQSWTRLQTLLAVSSILAFTGLALSIWAWSGAVVPWDSKNQFYPFFRFLSDNLSRSELPLWNPYHFGGHPSVADPQSLLFTPSMVIFALLDPRASMQTFDIVIFCHLMVGGIGVLGLFRRRGWHPAGAVLAAMIFMLGGVASSRLQHTGMIISYSYYPLALLTLELALARRSWGFATAFGLLGACMVIGRDQVAVMLAVSLVGAAIWHASRADRPLAYVRSRLPLVLLSGAIVICLIAIPSLLTMQFLAASNRPGIAYGVAAAGSLHPANLATFLTGDIFGSNDWNYGYWGPGYEATEYADYTDRTVNYVFTGTLSALLFVWHGIAGGRIFGRGIRFFVIMGAVACFYAVGRYTPFFGFLFDHVPTVSLYRRPADASFLINIGLAMTAGYLLHRYVAEGLPRPFRSLPSLLAMALIAGAVALVGILVGAALSFAHTRTQFPASLQALAVAAAISTGFALTMYFANAGGPRRRAIAAVALVCISGAELLARNAASPMNAEPASSYAVYDGLAPADRRGLELLAEQIRQDHARGSFPRVEIIGLGGPWQNAAMVLGLENTLGYNPLRIADYERAVGPGENAGDMSLRHFPETFRGYRCHLAGLLGLQYLVLDRPLSELPRHFPRPRATPIYRGHEMFIYRLGDPAPRAYLAMQVKPIDRETVLDQSAIPDFDRAREVLIDDDSMSDLREVYALRDDEPLPPSHVSIRRYDGNRVVIDVDGDRAGVLVLHDLYFPGWQVRVDGEAKPLLRANLLFRGVEVPAGHHVVEFEFKPFTLANLASIVSGLGHRKSD